MTASRNMYILKYFKIALSQSKCSAETCILLGGQQMQRLARGAHWTALDRAAALGRPLLPCVSRCAGEKLAWAARSCACRVGRVEHVSENRSERTCCARRLPFFVPTDGCSRTSILRASRVRGQKQPSSELAQAWVDLTAENTDPSKRERGESTHRWKSILPG